MFIKRDDLTGFALAGNKARKLEFIVADAIVCGADTIVTGGGPGSNHCQATAVAAAVAGLGCHLVLYGHEPATDTINVSIARACGASLTFTGSADRSTVDRTIAEVAERLRSEGRAPYVVPRGGATPLGAAAYTFAAFELADQLRDHEVDSATVILASGSCGTQAGLEAGKAIRGLRWEIVGAAVSRPVDECRERVVSLAEGAMELLGVPGELGHDVRLVDARGLGYGEPSGEGDDAVLRCLRTEGLLLDPTFTAKAFAVLLRMVEDGHQGPIVFLHTGGTTTALERLERIASTQGSSPADD